MQLKSTNLQSANVKSIQNNLKVFVYKSLKTIGNNTKMWYNKKISMLLSI